MNETDPIRLPKFLEGEKLPPEYYFPPDPSRNPPVNTISGRWSNMHARTERT